MEAKRVTRRKHSRAFKDEVLAACRQPGTSVAAIAMAHGVNANLVHRWLRNAARAGLVSVEDHASHVAATSAGEFIALPLPTPTAPPMPDIRIELRKGATAVKVSWPLQGASDCAAWLREWLP